jgi:hypothetical protein
MSTDIVLGDGRAMITSNGIYDTIVETIVSILDAGKPPGQLGAWLLEQRCEVQGPGVGHLDLRELAPAARKEVERALPLALERLDPSGHEAMAKSIQLLQTMLAQPEVVDPDVRGGIVPPTGERKGPGWENR